MATLHIPYTREAPNFSLEGPKLKHSSGSWAKNRHILNYIVSPLKCPLSLYALIMINIFELYIFEEHFHLTIDTTVRRTGVSFSFFLQFDPANIL